MELTQLRYFQAAAQYEHMTRAAEALYTSQSSLSKTIARLEAEIGQPLFDRIGNRIRLNAAGRQFAQAVNLMLRTLDDSVSTLRQENVQVSMAVSIPGLLPDLMERFRTSHPTVQLQQRLMEPSAMLSALLQCQLDLAVSHQPLHHGNVIWRPVYRDRVIAVVSLAHPLAAGGAIPLSKLKNEQFVSNNAGFGAEQLLHGLCAQAGFIPKVSLECNEPELLYKIVAGNNGVMLTPELPFLWKALMLHPDPPFQFLTTLPLTDPDAYVEIGLGTLRDRQLPSSAEDFCQLVIGSFQRLQAVRDSGREIVRNDLMQALDFVNPLT